MAKKVFKIALPGYNAETDTDPNHFSLYVDQTTDYVLAKEKTRGSATVSNNATVEVTHGLGYIPFVLCFMDNEDGSYTWLKGLDANSVVGEAGFRVDTTKLYLTNVSGSSKTLKYYIFYDDFTEP